MSQYLKKFSSMVKELEKFDFAEIVEFTTHSPVTKSQLKEVEKALDTSLAKPILDFYEETNGLKLHWRIKPNLSIEDTKKLRKKSTDYYPLIAEYIEDPFAIINILSIQDVIKSKWKDIGFAYEEKTIEFAKESYDKKEFIKMLKPFDIINREYCASFLFEKESENPSVILLTDGCADWGNSLRTDFESYLEMLLATKGIVEARTKIFEKTRGDLKPPLIKEQSFWEKNYAPKMFD